MRIGVFHTISLCQIALEETDFPYLCVFAKTSVKMSIQFDFRREDCPHFLFILQFIVSVFLPFIKYECWWTLKVYIGLLMGDLTPPLIPERGLPDMMSASEGEGGHGKTDI